MHATNDTTDHRTRQLEALVTLVRATLGPDVVGAYLYGSAVLGGQVPTSDIDLLAVSRRRLTDPQREHLAAELLSLSVPPDSEKHGRPESRPIELTIVVHSAVRPWRYPPEMEFQYGDWLRDEVAAGHRPVRATNHDLAVLIELARRGGRSVLGPPPDQVFEPVPWHDVVASMNHGVAGLLKELETDTRNVILTLARIWMTLETGDIRRKDEAAAWAAERLPADFAAVLKRARELYVVGRYGPWGAVEPAVRRAAYHLAAEIRRPRRA